MEEDRETNLLACEASLALQNHARAKGEKVKVSKVAAVNPEAFFNRSIVHIGNGDLKKAEKACNNAKNEYEAYDDLEADELEQELAPIQAQLALIYQLQGEKGKSLGMYQRVLNSQPDLILTSVVNNNIIANNQDQNLFESKKKAKALQTKNDALLKKLQSTQLITMELNKALVAYASGQFTSALEIIHELANAGKKLCTDLHEIRIIKAACLAKLNRLPEATDLLKAEIAKIQTEADVERLNLALAQLDLGSANTDKYAASAAFIALDLARAGQENMEAECAVMKRAESLWTDVNDVKRARILTKYGEALLKLGDEEEACKIYEELSNNNDEFLPKFIEVASRVDPNRGRQAAARLPGADLLTNDVDVEKLEEMAGIAGSRYANKRREVKTVVEEAQMEKPKKKRKRKPKLPKSADAAKPFKPENEDQERWLPLRDRSYYRGRRFKKSRTGAMRGPQGAANDAQNTAQLDASKASFTGGNQSSTSRSGKGKGKGGKGGKRRK